MAYTRFCGVVVNLGIYRPLQISSRERIPRQVNDRAIISAMVLRGPLRWPACALCLAHQRNVKRRTRDVHTALRGEAGCNRVAEGADPGDVIDDTGWFKS